MPSGAITATGVSPRWSTNRPSASAERPHPDRGAAFFGGVAQMPGVSPDGTSGLPFLSGAGCCSTRIYCLYLFCGISSGDACFFGPPSLDPQPCLRAGWMPCRPCRRHPRQPRAGRPAAGIPCDRAATRRCIRHNPPGLLTDARLAPCCGNTVETDHRLARILNELFD